MQSSFHLISKAAMNSISTAFSGREHGPTLVEFSASQSTNAAAYPKSGPLGALDFPATPSIEQLAAAYFIRICVRL